LLNQVINNNNLRIFIETVLFLLVLVIIFFIFRIVYNKVKNIVSKTPGKFDDLVFDLFRFPALWFIYWVLLKIFTHLFLNELSFFPVLIHINTLLLIFSVTWIIIQLVKAGSYYVQNKLDIKSVDNLNARKTLTQLKVFQHISITIVVILAVSISLLTFEKARTIGLSLLTSAGVIGIIIGLAAQKSIGMILAGIQIAITQPIRLDDVVIVENEWGRVEEITLTYVVIKIWDERRLVLPVTYFLEKPFQNWTRTSAEITGTIFLYTGYDFPVEELRKILPSMLEGNPNWDGRFLNVQVTNTTELNKEIRILVSSSDASKNWDLRAFIREKLIDFINSNFPECFAKIRLNKM